MPKERKRQHSTVPFGSVMPSSFNAEEHLDFMRQQLRGLSAMTRLAESPEWLEYKQAVLAIADEYKTAIVDMADNAQSSWKQIELLAAMRTVLLGMIGIVQHPTLETKQLLKEMERHINIIEETTDEQNPALTRDTFVEDAFPDIR